MTENGAFAAFVASGAAITAGAFAHYDAFYVAGGFAATSAVFAVALLFDLVTGLVRAAVQEYMRWRQ